MSYAFGHLVDALPLDQFFIPNAPVAEMEYLGVERVVHMEESIQMEQPKWMIVQKQMQEKLLNFEGRSSIRNARLAVEEELDAKFPVEYVLYPKAPRERRRMHETKYPDWKKVQKNMEKKLEMSQSHHPSVSSDILDSWWMILAREEVIGVDGELEDVWEQEPTLTPTKLVDWKQQQLVFEDQNNNHVSTTEVEFLGMERVVQMEELDPMELELVEQAQEPRHQKPPEKKPKWQIVQERMQKKLVTLDKHGSIRKIRQAAEVKLRFESAKSPPTLKTRPDWKTVSQEMEQNLVTLREKYPDINSMRLAAEMELAMNKDNMEKGPGVICSRMRVTLPRPIDLKPGLEAKLRDLEAINQKSKEPTKGLYPDLEAVFHKMEVLHKERIAKRAAERVARESASQQQTRQSYNQYDDLLSKYLQF